VRGGKFYKDVVDSSIKKRGRERSLRRGKGERMLAHCFARRGGGENARRKEDDLSRKREVPSLAAREEKGRGTYSWREARNFEWKGER